MDPNDVERKSHILYLSNKRPVSMYAYQINVLVSGISFENNLNLVDKLGSSSFITKASLNFCTISR